MSARMHACIYVDACMRSWYSVRGRLIEMRQPSHHASAADGLQFSSK